MFLSNPTLLGYSSSFLYSGVDPECGSLSGSPSAFGCFPSGVFDEQQCPAIWVRLEGLDLVFCVNKS